jgi:hypothetical protein
MNQGDEQKLSEEEINLQFHNRIDDLKQRCSRRAEGLRSELIETEHEYYRALCELQTEWTEALKKDGNDESK